MKIYTLSHPVTKEIKYVGVTSGLLNQRLSQHIWDSKHKFSYKCNWIRHVVNTTGLIPVIELLEEVSEDTWEIMEVYWIQQLRCWGHSLVNMDVGGKGVIKDSNGRKRSAIAHQKPVYRYTLQGVFIDEWESITKASSYFSVTEGAISCCAKGKSKTSVGYRWSFMKHDNLTNVVIRSRMDQYKVTITYPDSTVKEFSSKCAANRYLGYRLTKKRIRESNLCIELIKI